MQRGSLRWLEAELGRRGGNPAALRNIVYRDVGTVADKEKLAAILRDLAAEAGVTGLDLVPAPPPPARAFAASPTSVVRPGMPLLLDASDDAPFNHRHQSSPII